MSERSKSYDGFMHYDYEFEFPGVVIEDEGPGHVLGVPITREMTEKHAQAMAAIALSERQADEEGRRITFY